MPGWLTWLHPGRSKKAGLSPEIENALKMIGVRHYDVDLLDQDNAWLRQQFPRDGQRVMKETFFMVEKAIAPHLTTGAEVVQKRVGFRTLSQAFDDFASWKMIHADPVGGRTS